MKRIIVMVSLFVLFIAGCSSQPEAPEKTFTEQDIRNAVTELIEGINNGDVDTVKKYVGVAGPVADKLIEKLKNNIKLSNVRDIKIQGTSAQATVTVEVVPLKINKDITLNFNLTDVLMLDNPLGLLPLLL
jgi:PBP1b-binding outer membrane lipoprotein LpoB